MPYLNYLFFRLFALPLEYLPYKALHQLGNIFGLLVYYCYPKYRKRALSNLALATDLHLTPSQIIATAKKSLQNLAITALQYPRLKRDNNIHNLATCENPETAAELIKSGKGVIFFCGHQTNWEILFLEGTKRMPGVAIGRPIKNHHLYSWITQLREKFGGTMIPPQNAYKESFRALKKGKFVGIVGDQGMPDSGFTSPFLGREAWTSPLPALLSSRTGCPVIVATTRREKEKYIIHYSDPIEPTENPHDQMRQILAAFEATIQARPHEWLWIHNRWKQQPPGILKKQFRHDAIGLIFSSDPANLTALSEIRQLYPREHITAFIPASVILRGGEFFHFDNASARDSQQAQPAPKQTMCEHMADAGGCEDRDAGEVKMKKFTASQYITDAAVEIQPYHSLEELLLPDYRFKLVVDFTGSKELLRHFAKLSALHVASFKTLQEFLAHARR